MTEGTAPAADESTAFRSGPSAAPPERSSAGTLAAAAGPTAVATITAVATATIAAAAAAPAVALPLVATRHPVSPSRPFPAVAGGSVVDTRVGTDAADQ